MPNKLIILHPLFSPHMQEKNLIQPSLNLCQARVKKCSFMPNLLVTPPSQLPLMYTKIMNSPHLSVKFNLMHQINQSLRISALQIWQQGQQAMGIRRLFLIVNMDFDYCKTICMFWLFLGLPDTIIFIFGQPVLFIFCRGMIHLFILYIHG
jgi:hypothetical protein